MGHVLGKNSRYYIHACRRANYYLHQVLDWCERAGQYLRPQITHTGPRLIYGAAPLFQPRHPVPHLISLILRRVTSHAQLARARVHAVCETAAEINSACGDQSNACFHFCDVFVPVCAPAHPTVKRFTHRC